jgi:CRISPR/Cas system-associated endonuclease Cas1
MTSLYVDRRGVTLKADGEALVFYENGERIGTVPLAPLSRVFLRGDVTLSSALLGKLGERGIGVVVLSGRKAVPTMLLGRPHNDAARRVAQYRCRSMPISACAFRAPSSKPSCARRRVFSPSAVTASRARATC